MDEPSIKSARLGLLLLIAPLIVVALVAMSRRQESLEASRRDAFTREEEARRGARRPGKSPAADAQPSPSPAAPASALPTPPTPPSLPAGPVRNGRRGPTRPARHPLWPPAPGSVRARARLRSLRGARVSQDRAATCTMTREGGTLTIAYPGVDPVVLHFVEAGVGSESPFVGTWQTQEAELDEGFAVVKARLTLVLKADKTFESATEERWAVGRDLHQREDVGARDGTWVDDSETEATLYLNAR